MHVYGYFLQKEQEIADSSLAPDRDYWLEMVHEEAGSHGRRGRLIGNLIMTDRAFIAFSESVVVQGNHVHREDYAYYLVIDGQDVWGEERDPSHDPPVHRHVGEHGNVEESTPISLKAFAARAWVEAGQRGA